MKFATSKELRLRTGEILEKVRAGGRFAITYRGKPVALLVPFEEDEELSPRPYAEAWADLQRALEATEPYYPDWRDALRESRRQK
jgi:prevent-host-death family protein